MAAFFVASFIDCSVLRDGKIPAEKWNPKGYQEATALRKSFKSERGVLDKVGITSNTPKIILAVAGIGVTAYLLSQMRRRGL